MREHFPSIPFGKTAIGSRYLRRLNNAVSRASGVPLGLQSPGQINAYGDIGHDIDFQPEVWIFVRITCAANPGTPFAGYSGIEVRPASNGAWLDAEPGEGLIFNNGAPECNMYGSGYPSANAYNPLYEANGRTDVTVGTVVQAFRGFQHGGTEQDHPGQEWVFFETGGGGSSSSDAAIVRILAYNDVLANTPYIADPSPPHILVFIGVIEQLIMPDIPFDTGTLVYLVPKYQVPIVGAITGLPRLPAAPAEYLSLYQNTTATEFINDNAGSEPLLAPFSGGANVTLPLFETTQYPAAVKLQCVGTPPEDQLIIGP